jgi:hypothetical protein
MIATNTVAQGITRGVGLRWICKNGGTIYSARRSMKWPGLAAVSVSVIHVTKGSTTLDAFIDGVRVKAISAFLASGSEHDNPVPLHENSGTAFLGRTILGVGFLFADATEGCTPLQEMHRLTTQNPSLIGVIRPAIGGEDLNSHPEQRTQRHAICFGDMTLEQASRWPEALEIVRARVKPERDRLGDTGDAKRRKANWWRYGQFSHALFKSITSNKRVLANSLVSSHLAFAWLPANLIFTHKLCVFRHESDAAFAMIQARIHEIWARTFSSTLEDRLNYSPSDCFETFPFPREWETDTALEDIGKRYHERRAEIMKARWEGLTKTYNRFHDPQCTDDDIVELRALHAEMDRAVLAAYGWTDLDLTTDFHPEHADEPDGKKRLRWSDGTRDAVLGRLLALNAERAAEERAAAGASGRAGRKGE